MIDILFRGRRKDFIAGQIRCTKEWVFGGVFESCIVERLDTGYINHIWVDSSTIGQYTGLHDSTKWEDLTESEQQKWLKRHMADEWVGKPIFDGDILKWDPKEWGSEHFEVVRWDYDLFAMRRNDWHEFCKVVGNVHDNPELLDVRNTSKEEAEAINSGAEGLKMLDFFGSGYAARFRCAFPKCFINMNNEVIIHPGRNSYFMLTGIKSEIELKAKVLEWLSREAVKGGTRATMAYHLNGINEILGTEFTTEQMAMIYTYLGNAVNHNKTIRFIESGYDFDVIMPAEKEMAANDTKG